MTESAATLASASPRPSAEVRRLRRQMREWRRGRADTTLMQVLSDAYIAVFTTVMIGATAISAIIQTRVSISSGCTTGSCPDSRHALGWVSGLAVVAVVLAASRAVGPLLMSPAAGSWILSTPLDRGPLLRPRLLAAGALAAGSSAVLSTVALVLAGFSADSATAYVIVVAAAASCAVMSSAICQPRKGHAVRGVTWLLGGATWLGLVAIATGMVPSVSTTATVGGFGIAGVLISVVSWLIALGLTTKAVRSLRRIHRDQLTPGGSLLASLSGALASLDLSLMYDILVARRWLTKATVRSVRGGPTGAWALVWRDVIRLRRSASTLVVVASALVVPYVVVVLDLGRLILLVGAMTAFFTGVSLFSALRTTSRNPGLVRCFPMSAAAVRAACLVVPGTVLVLWALVAMPAVHSSMDPISWSDTLQVSLAMGMAGVGSVARWLLAAPPDYSSPLVSSPAGGIPTGLIGSVLRGFDVLALLTAPILIAPSSIGAAISLALAAIVLTVLVGRK